MANSDSGHVSASPGSWVSVALIVLAFIVGTFALITGSIALWVITGVCLVAGVIAGFASHIMEQAY